MSVQEELKSIEIEVAQKTKEALEFMQSLYPLNDEYFMNDSEKQKIKAMRDYVESLSKKYISIFYNMPLEERNKYSYQNLLGQFNSALSSIDGLDTIGPYSDEYDLRDAFSKAYKFAKESIEKLIKAEKEQDIDSVNRNKRIISACDDVFDGHFWGESYKNNIREYENRLRTGRTVDDDLKEYYELVDETKALSVEYAKAIKSGITEDQREAFFNRFEVIFSREEKLLKFVPREMIDYVNLHWLKIDAERDPDKVIEQFEVSQNIK